MEKVIEKFRKKVAKKTKKWALERLDLDFEK